MEFWPQTKFPDALHAFSVFDETTTRLNGRSLVSLITCGPLIYCDQQWRSQPSVNVYSYLSNCRGPRAPKALHIEGGLWGFSPQENLKL